MQQQGSAQLVTYFDPGLPPAPETTIDRALMQWSALADQARDEALLIVHDADGGRHVYDRTAIAAMLARG